MKLVYLTAGAGGMYCGSCLHDNALAKAVALAGWNVQLVPLYTPIRTDEEDISIDRVFFGGINVYLQQKIPFFRHLPKWLDGFLDQPWLIRRATSRAIETDAHVLGELALSMLKGPGGNQRKEVLRLIRWLEADKADMVVSSNLLIAGFVPEFKRRNKVPVVVTLQGDDVFLNQLSESDRRKCLQQIHKNNESVDAFLVHSEAFRKYASEYFEIPLSKIFVTPLGIETTDFEALAEETSANTRESGRTIGYLARLAPEKGLQHLVSAFISLKQNSEFDDVRLRLAGWLSPENKAFVDEQWQRLRDANLGNAFHYDGVVDRTQKLAFLRDIDLLCVPVDHEEPKGLFALESLAAGTPVVLSRKGALTEIVESSQGGLLFELGNDEQFQTALTQLLRNEALRKQLGDQGRKFVLTQRNQREMASETMQCLMGIANRE